MHLPAPLTATLQGLNSWAAVFRKAVSDALDNDATLNSRLSAQVAAIPAPNEAYVPMQFAGTPLTWVTETGGQVILIGFSPP